MLSREQAERALAMRAEGQPIRAIARQMGHSPQTIRDYVRGRKFPGRRAPKPDEFTAFSDYCRRRLTDDPHLVPRALFDEVTGLGYPGSRPTFYRAFGRHDLLDAGCPQCHTRPARPRPSASTTTPTTSAQPLPIPVSPVTGETLASYLDRLSAANHVTIDDLLTILPPWFHTKIRNHDDRGQHHMLAPAAPDALHRLAAITGRAPAALAHALPAFAGSRIPAPVRATTACRRCMAAHGIHQPVPVHRLAHHQICTRHGLWLSATNHPQLDLTNCPDIIAAQHRTRRLLQHCTPQRLLFAHLAATRLILDLPGDAATSQHWQQRLHRLTATNRHLNNPAIRDHLTQAATYPDAIDQAHTMLTTRAG